LEVSPVPLSFISVTQQNQGDLKVTLIYAKLGDRIISVWDNSSEQYCKSLNQEVQLRCLWIVSGFLMISLAILQDCQTAPWFREEKIKSSPEGSWDSKVSIVYTLHNLAGRSTLGDPTTALVYQFICFCFYQICFYCFYFSSACSHPKASSNWRFWPCMAPFSVNMRHAS